jgi:hypothetical protein
MTQTLEKKKESKKLHRNKNLSEKKIYPDNQYQNLNWKPKKYNDIFLELLFRDCIHEHKY